MCYSKTYGDEPPPRRTHAIANDQKEVRRIIAQAETWPGWRVERKTDGWMLYPADKRHGPITVHLTNSDHRWRKNLRSQLRRAGAPI